MELLNLSVDRIIIHQVFQRDSDGNIVQPTQSHDFTNFEQSAKDTFVSRVTDSLGSSSKAVQMEIVSQSANSLPKLINTMVEQEDENFAVSSYDVAVKLAHAQQTRNIPGGIVIVFTGKYSASPKSYLGIIKAEVHSGYEKETTKEDEITLKFVEELLLTPGTKLYKTAGFFRRNSNNSESESLNDKWIVMLSDYQISKTEGKAAAKYFYIDFLGCGYPQSSARTTMNFYDSTKQFISDLDVSPEKKSDLINALVTYLKVDTSQTISSSDFSEKYFSNIETRDDYENFMRDTNIPEGSFTKDTEYIVGKLKTRKLRFRKNIQIVAPADILDEYVTIETIKPKENEEVAEGTRWTQVTIKDLIVNQE